MDLCDRTIVPSDPALGDIWDINSRCGSFRGVYVNADVNGGGADVGVYGNAGGADIVGETLQCNVSTFLVGQSSLFLGG